MSIYVIGVNHKTAPIALREKIYFAVDKLSLYLQDLLTRGYAHEAVLLSTCNRSELYCETDDAQAVCDWFCAQTNATRAELDSALYVYRDQRAVAHMMDVSCGLDSMVLGEPQILGQMKEAFSESCSAGAVGAVFHRLFQQIFSTAKDIRTATAIGACPVSVASAAVHFVKQHVASFANAKIILIGAGDTAALMMRYLKAHTANVTLVNRSIENAEVLAAEFGGKVVGIEKLPSVLKEADIVFSATGSAVPVVTREMVVEAIAARLGAPILLLDIAVPRDIDPAIANVAGAQLYCIDDLRDIIEHNRQGREHAAEKAREMIQEKSSDFIAGLTSIDKVSHAISVYRGQIEALCRAELLKAKRQLLQGADPVEVLDAFAYTFTQKLLHAPSVQLRQAGVEGRFELLKFAKQLFGIPEPEVEAKLS
jgi:glutamyl-tRNA reductase